MKYKRLTGKLKEKTSKWILNPPSEYLKMFELDVRGSVYHSIIHIEKIQQDATVYQNLLFHVYMKLNMFRTTHRPSSGA
jgi:hypothetical protein